MAGRPTKPAEDRRTNTLRIRLTEAERAILDRYAAQKTLETSTWARMMLLELAEKNHMKKPRKGKKSKGT